MAFDEVRFPEDISCGASGGPQYSTDIVVTNGGYEQRRLNWEESRAVYNVAHSVKDKTQLDELIAFFRARKGKANGFRFKDWTDYQATSQQIGIGDDVKTEFQLIKSYVSGSVSEIKTIKKPVSGTIKVYFDSIEQLSGFSTDASTGVVTFDSAPSSGVSITSDFDFDIPVRFDTDILNAQIDNFGVFSWQNINIVEIRQ